MDSDLVRVIAYGTGGTRHCVIPGPRGQLAQAYCGRTRSAQLPSAHQGVSTQHRGGRVAKVPGTGVVQTNAFIDQATAPAGLLTNAGDDRGFDPAALPDTSRVTFLIDYENGIVVAWQNPSIRLDDGAVLTGRPDISVGQESSGRFTSASMPPTRSPRSWTRTPRRSM